MDEPEQPEQPEAQALLIVHPEHVDSPMTRKLAEQHVAAIMGNPHMPRGRAYLADADAVRIPASSTTREAPCS